jgi:hypothetical protein
MKVRLEHNLKNDHYSFKKDVKIVERDQFYESSEMRMGNQTQIQDKNY